MAKDYLNDNRLDITGKLIEPKVTVDTDGNGKERARGSFSVVINDEPIPVNFYSNRITKAGNESKAYPVFANIKDLENQRVTLFGASISTSPYVPQGTNDIKTPVKFRTNGLRLARANEADKFTFEFTGFVRKPLIEKLNKKDELYAYEIVVAQSNYNKDGLIIVPFMLDPKDNRKAAALGSLEKGDTIKLYGEVKYRTEINDVEEGESLFGEPIIKQYQNTYKSIMIENASLLNDNPLSYESEDITTLEAAYALKEEAELERSKQQGQATATQGAQTSTQGTANTSISSSSGLGAVSNSSKLFGA